MSRRPQENESEPAPKSGSAAARRSSARAESARELPLWRYGVVAVGIAAGALVITLLLQYSERFLIRDTRFEVAPPAEIGEESASLRLAGVRYAARQQVLGVFTKDLGRSLYLLPAAERRRQLLAVDWVKDASISRVWPNQVDIRITERQPVAFVRLAVLRARPGTFHSALIDEDGVILAPHTPARFALPVVTGIRREEDESGRRERIRRVLRMLRELGQLGDKFSEIDVADTDNIQVTQPVDGGAVVLYLGNHGFLARMQTFFSHYPDIRKRMPNVSRLDLRLEDRITAIEEGGNDE